MTAAPGTTVGVERPPGLLHPLASHGFALIAGATLVSNIGVWMRDTTSAWSVANGVHHHSSVALVQAATAAPTFFLALPAGVLADHVDRRRLLIFCQAALAAIGVLLAVLSWRHLLDVGSITLLALAAGSAAALSAPTFQAIVPSLVAKADVGAAVALSSISFNIARVIGPSAGAILLATNGAAAAYLCNAAAYGAVILALLAVPRASQGRTEHTPLAFGPELQSGMAFVASSTPFRHVLARGLGLYASASCYLALTPLIAHDVLGKSPNVYGVLLAALGLGSIAGGVILSFTRRIEVSPSRLLTVCAGLSVAALVVLALARDVPSAAVALALAGASTLMQTALLNAAAQELLPDAVRGRGLSIYLAATLGAMAVGSLAWGALSDTFSIQAALLLGAFSFAASGLAGRYLPIGQGPEPLDAQPSAGHRNA